MITGAPSSTSKQLDDVNTSHSHTTLARQATDFALMSCPVYIDEPVARIGVVFVQTIEP
jgi:hypothetical protein